MHISLPNSYQALAERMLALDVVMSPAETQGVLCGLICGGGNQAEALWLEEVLGVVAPGDGLAMDNRRDWMERARDIRVAIEEGRLGSSLLLPTDEQPLRERASALNDWSRGFLYGLGLADRPQGRLPPEVGEVLGDLVEITRMDLDGLEEDEENEAAFAELAEFVWVAASLVFEELGRGADS